MAAVLTMCISGQHNYACYTKAFSLDGIATPKQPPQLVVVERNAAR